MSCSSSQLVCRLAAGMWSALCHITPHHTVADHMRPDQGIRRKEVNREKRVGRRVDVDINPSLAREWRVLCSSRLCYQIRLESIS